MKHELYYRTELGGCVCNCLRYFDNEDELNEHIQWRNIIILGFMIGATGIVCVAIGEILTMIQPIGNIFAYIGLTQGFIGLIMVTVGVVKGGVLFD